MSCTTHPKPLYHSVGHRFHPRFQVRLCRPEWRRRLAASHAIKHFREASTSTVPTSGCLPNLQPSPVSKWVGSPIYLQAFRFEPRPTSCRWVSFVGEKLVEELAETSCCSISSALVDAVCRTAVLMKNVDGPAQARRPSQHATGPAIQVICLV